MAFLPPDIVALINAEKSLIVAPKWDDESDPRYMVALHPLQVGGVTTGGFELRLKASKQFPDRDGMGQIEYAPAGRRSAVPLWRICWKPFHDHPNGAKPPEHAFEIIESTHEHVFLDNFAESEHRMVGANLPAARPTPRDPATFSEFLALCGERFRIVDMRLVTIPTFSGDLFWMKNG